MREPIFVPRCNSAFATPAEYLKHLQTDLTWRMNELVSENQTVQRNLLMSIYKQELANAGVVFDKTNDAYTDSILGRMELVINERSQKEYERKAVGGFKNQLEPLGIDVENVDTWPKEVDLEVINKKLTEKEVEKSNLDKDKDTKLKALRVEGDGIVLKIKEANSEIDISNKDLKADYNDDLDIYNKNGEDFISLETEIIRFTKNGCFTEEYSKKLIFSLADGFKNEEPEEPKYAAKVLFDEEGKINSKKSDFDPKSDLYELLTDLGVIKQKYREEKARPANDTTKIDEEIKDIEREISSAIEKNNRFKMLDSFNKWHDAEMLVRELREEYYNMLSSIDTGVEGLKITVDNQAEKLDIYLNYNGSYDTKYFGNAKKEDRKVSSYSGTQKTIICLLLQSYLLGKKEKAMRYLWIDDVPIDNKTKDLLNVMGSKLGVTIIVNITGDFNKENLDSGEILIEGGEVFFNK